jgi:3-oxoacid CoA-transferase subunit B
LFSRGSLHAIGPLMNVAADGLVLIEAAPGVREDELREKTGVPFERAA